MSLPSFVMLASLLAVTASPQQETPSVKIDNDLTQLPEDDVTEDLRAWLTKLETQVLEDGGVAITQDAPRTIRVAVRQTGKGDLNYEATITLTRDDAAEPEVTRVVLCEACSETELVDKVGIEVARISGRLIDERDASPRDEPSKGTPPSGPNGQSDKPPPRPIGPVGYTGIVVGAAGLATAIAGGVFLGRGDEVTAADGAGASDVKHNGRLGGPLLGVGVGVLVVGAIMVGVDVGRRAKQRRGHKSARLTIDARPSFTGFMVQGRF